VEDSPLDAELVRAHLEEAGLVLLLERVDGEAAFREAVGRRRFDLVLADYRVPGFEGTRTLALARELCPDTPLLFVSGALGEERAVDLLKLGATDYVLKDNLARLVPSVERALEEVRARAERLAAVEALRRSEERLRRVVEATSAGTWEMDLATGELLPDPLLAGLLGLPPGHGERFPQEAVLERLHPEDRPAVQAAMAAALAGQAGGRYVAEMRVRTPDGRGVERWMEARGQVFFDGAGRPVRFLGTGLDVSERKQAEEERRRRSEFEQQLIGIVSHDLRSPLQTILLGTQMLLRRDELDARTTKAVNRIQTATERAARMVRDLLDFTRARLGGGLPLVRAAADLHQVAHGVVEEAQAAHPERVLVVEARGDGAGAWDVDRLHQLLTNLVANAVAYSPPDSPVRVCTAGEGEEVALQVHNAGAPIPPALLPHLFEPLTRGVEGIGHAERSVGLGLYIVDQVVRAHGGAISVTSTAEAGTTFTVRLPRRPAA
jgi:PAS domain S-box-containing protein